MRSIAPFLASLPLLALAGFLACSDRGSSSTGDTPQGGCTPGSQLNCTCNGTDTGKQTCDANRKFGSCQCEPSDAGGGGAGGGEGEGGGDGGLHFYSPVTLALGQPAPRDIAVDSVNVYWSSAGNDSVSRCKRTGCGSVPTVLAKEQAYPASLAATSGLVLWTNLGLKMDGGVPSDGGAGVGSVVRIAATEADGMPQTIASNQTGPDAIAADPNFVYWSVDGEVRQCDLLVCQKAIALYNDTADGIAVDALNVYWISNTAPGTVNICSIGGCAGSPKVIADNQGAGALRGIAVDEKNVYWATSTEVRACPIAGCSLNGPSVLANQQSIVGLRHPLATDGEFLYWGTGTTLVRCATTGCPEGPTVLADKQMAPTGVALAPDAVYWIDGDSIKSVQKPK